MSTLPAFALTPALSGSRRVGRLLALMALTLALVFGGIAWLQSQSLRLLSANVVYQGDNLVWSFFQLETEYLRLRHLAHEFVREAPHLPAAARAALEARLRERYDIFVSRIGLIDPARTQGVMPDFPEHHRVMAELAAVVDQVDRVLGPEAPPEIDAAALRPLLGTIDGLATSVRELSGLSNRAVGEGIVSRNEAVRQQSRIAIALTVFQCLLILVFAVIVVRQVRALEQRRLELEALARRLQEARVEAEQASRAKSAFLANMSHELRTPFNGMLGMLSMLDRSPLDAQQREHLQIARQSGEHLLTILNDVLDLSKLESAHLDLAPQPVDLPRLLGEVEALMRPQARAKSLHFEITVDAAVPARVEADGKRLKQVLFNLLGNAIKFTDQGRVGLLVDTVPAATPEASPRVRLRVVDSGIGMDEATLQRLFQRFSQGDDSIGRRFGGTGLGLEISRELVRMMGGDIQVTSQPGVGSEFVAVLPLPWRVDVPESESEPEAAASAPGPACDPAEGTHACADAPGPVAAPVLPARPLDILVTDDHQINQKFMRVLLESLGHRVSLALDGQDAFEQVRTRTEAPFDLVLMDVHMPVMDGLAATRAIRALPSPMNETRIVALTADAFTEVRARASEAGMSDFLAKPVQVHEVEALLLRHFGVRGVNRALPSLPAPASRPARSTRPRRGDAGRVLDLELISDTCALLGVERLRTLLQAFFSDDSGAVTQLLALLAQASAEGLPMAAHRVRGTAATLGLKQLAATVADIEQHGLGAGDPAEALEQQLRQQIELSWRMCARMGWATPPDAPA
ncbi:MAG: hypothetical protein RLZZ592_442 [Pseudomonadota bacterium]